jgi:hypothetical protein
MWHVGGREECGRGWGNLRERNHLEDLGVNRSIILQWNLGTRIGRMWIELIWLKDIQRVIANTIMNLRVP